MPWIYSDLQAQVDLRPALPPPAIWELSVGYHSLSACSNFQDVATTLALHRLLMMEQMTWGGLEDPIITGVCKQESPGKLCSPLKGGWTSKRVRPVYVQWTLVCTWHSGESETLRCAGWQECQHQASCPRAGLSRALPGPRAPPLAPTALGLDASYHHPVRRGPQPRHAALPGNLAPARGIQEPLQTPRGPQLPRCGVPDLPQDISARNRQKRFVLSGGRWEKTDLTYRILRFPWQLVPERVRQTVAEALQVWSEVTPLTFTEVHEGRADIMIDFTRYWHGDNLPFDGPGGILAHAFFPKTHREGDVHFDYDETWTVGDDQGTDLLQVAAHEFGHVLGLQHTTAAKALMSPFYTFRYPLSLSPDDRRGIQHLYGRPRSAPSTLGPRAGMDTNEIAQLEPEVPPDACETSFDAVSTIRGELFFFKGSFVWRLREGRLQPGYPALASRHWEGLPSSVDAAFEDAQGHIWFFRGAQYWKYDGEKPVRGPVPLSELGLMGSPVDAALAWGPEKNKIYFFRGEDYWRFHPSSNRVDSPVPRRTTDWRGVPSEIEAAFQDADGYAYFLRGSLYWKFDPVKVKALDGFPRLVGPDFFGCTEPANTFH
ncbi:PREDICTED: stromelysin-3 [Elephantulus edwardii]|uniref:stromelysin-3 n=1 Tax=Elephantulus edwardii TaxID=28737 RepID=UPI0003F093F2|nr:PREDICTED: stromelysin-3 [Elephantulus edwardii]